MSLERLLRSRIIRRISPNHGLAVTSLRRARRDLDTAKALLRENRFDWSLAISYNAMLQAGRALMFGRGYRPSSTEGHVAVVNFLRVSVGKEINDKMVLVLDRMRKKRHRVVYGEIDVISEGEAAQSLKWAQEFVNKIEKIIRPEEAAAAAEAINRLRASSKTPGWSGAKEIRKWRDASKSS